MFTQAEQTYYALYYYKVDDPDAVGDEYRRVMVAPDDWTGSYCIVSSDKGKIMTNTPGSKPTYLEAADIEIDTGSVRDPKWVYTLTAAGDGTYYVRDAAGLYLSCTGKKNVSLTETPDDTCRWTPTLNGLQSDNGMLQYNAVRRASRPTRAVRPRPISTRPPRARRRGTRPSAARSRRRMSTPGAPGRWSKRRPAFMTGLKQEAARAVTLWKTA